MLLTIIAALLLSVLCASVGLFMVLRRVSFIGDGLAHISLGGVAASLLTRIDMIIAALVTTVVSAIAIARITQRTRLGEDVVIMVFFAASLALAAVLLSFAPSVDIEGLLFGDLSTVTMTDISIIGVLALLVIGMLLANFRGLVFATFDAESATVSGVSVSKLHYLLLILVALTITAGIKVAGVLLVASLMTVPTATALLLRRGFKETALIANCLAAASVVVGSLAALYFSISSGGAIVLTSVLIFFVVLAVRVASKPSMK
jgi:zinc transport system permease protein